jgi:hypothetical protein
MLPTPVIDELRLAASERRRDRGPAWSSGSNGSKISSPVQKKIRAVTEEKECGRQSHRWWPSYGGGRHCDGAISGPLKIGASSFFFWIQIMSGSAEDAPNLVMSLSGDRGLWVDLDRIGCLQLTHHQASTSPRGIQSNQAWSHCTFTAVFVVEHTRPYSYSTGRRCCCCGGDAPISDD